jgi:N-hydroxyarylamine O-acetyltransferase
MLTTTSLDLAAYLRRIGHDGPLAPDLATLRALVARHTAAIPFENLDPLMGRTPDLSLEGLQRKLVAEGRGGYCFEHNTLLKHVLEAIGFEVTGLAARVLWGRPEDAVTPRSHMLLRVDLAEGPHLVDVGFGSMTLTGVLRLAADEEQATPHEAFRLVRVGEFFHMQAFVREEWRTLYRFDLQPQLPVDYEVTNYYLANHPGSFFRLSLTGSRPAEEGRYTLLNGQFTHYPREGAPETRTLASVDEVRQVLTEHFRVQLPEAPELDEAIARVLQAG